MKSYFTAHRQMRACFATESQASSSAPMSSVELTKPFGQPVLTGTQVGTRQESFFPSSSPFIESQNH